MSCVLTAAIAAQCRDAVGGISKVWAVEVAAAHEGDATYVETSGALTTLTLETTPTARTIYAWNFGKDSASINEIVHTGNENGTTMYDHGLELSFWKWETNKRNEILIAATTPLLIVVKDQNSQYWALGLTRGLDMQDGAEATSGKLLNDKNGYTLQFMGSEPAPVIEITDAVFIEALP